MIAMTRSWVEINSYTENVAGVNAVAEKLCAAFSLPGLGSGAGLVPEGRDGEWSRGRLFAGVAELLAVVAGRSPSGVGLVVEDVH